MLRAALLAMYGAAAAICAAAPTPAASGAGAGSAPLPLLDCLESIARAFHVRIVDATALHAPVQCALPAPRQTLDQLLDQFAQRNRLGWRRLDDGTIEVVAAAAPRSVQLPALGIEGEPVAEPARPPHPAATPLIEKATAETTIDRAWLDSAPLLGFDQIGRYAPNVYGAGRSLAIRGMERDTDFFPALTVTFDGIDLGTRLLDDELVPLDGVTRLDLARGPRTFEAGNAAQAGAIALATAPPAVEAATTASLGIGNGGTRDAALSWTGPLGESGAGATFALDRRDLPVFVRQVVEPSADVDRRRNEFFRLKLSYQPPAWAGVSAGLAAIALSGDSSDRDIVPPPDPATAFDPFDRDSYAPLPVVARTHARGGAGFVRYEEPERGYLDAHASLTTIQRDATLLPQGETWTDREIRRHAGLTGGVDATSDWTFVAGLEHDDFATTFFTPFTTGSPLPTRLTRATDSASVWIEHHWAGNWSAGLGARWVQEQVGGYPGHATQHYRLPIPQAVIAWHPGTDQAFTLSYGSGYRSGGLLALGIPYAPERSRNLEFAWRAQWFGGALHSALSAFDDAIRDRFSYVRPTGRVRDRGLELEVAADLSERWHLRAGVGVLSSVYPSSVLRYGERTAEAPPQTATFGVRYGLAQGWYGALDAYRTAAAESEISGVPVGRLPSYDVIALRVGQRSAGRDIALIVANALDTRYVERFDATAGRNGYRLGDPRRVELRASWTW